MVVPATIATDSPELQMPDTHRLERMPCWPAWVASRIASMKVEVQPDETGRYRQMPTLPQQMMLKASEREAISHHLSELRSLCAQTPANDPNAERDMLVVLTKMMFTLPTISQNEISAEARGEAFMMALEDMPTWAVRAGVRRWYRGDCGNNAKGEPYDYHWCPAPAELRRISSVEMHRVKSRADALDNLLRAEQRLEFDEAHCQSMLNRIAHLFKNNGIPLVGETAAAESAGETPAASAHCGTQPKAGPGLKREGGCRRRGNRRK